MGQNSLRSVGIEFSALDLLTDEEIDDYSRLAGTFLTIVREGFSSFASSVGFTQLAESYPQVGTELEVKQVILDLLAKPLGESEGGETIARKLEAVELDQAVNGYHNLWCAVTTNHALHLEIVKEMLSDQTMVAECLKRLDVDGVAHNLLAWQEGIDMLLADEILVSILTWAIGSAATSQGQSTPEFSYSEGVTREKLQHFQNILNGLTDLLGLAEICEKKLGFSLVRHALSTFMLPLTVLLLDQ